MKGLKNEHDDTSFRIILDRSCRFCFGC